MAVPCDVTDQQQVESMVRTVLDRYGQIDVLINNAGTIQVGPLEATTLEDFDHEILAGQEATLSLPIPPP
jgi:NADP-dependent 3-hydroxy acid dehydrogenase YdfG